MLFVDNVSKNYRGSKGIENICFSCGNGNVVAVVGPNGAGKSTLLKIMAGVIKPDSGAVRLGEHSTGDFLSRKQIGYMPDDFQIKESLGVRDFLYLLSDYKYEGRFKDEAEKAIVDFQLTEHAGKKFGELSMGNRRKVSMAAAFIGRPELVILDEPTNGIDTAGILALKEYMERICTQGSIVIVSSHVLDFIDKVADQYIFLKDGNIAALGSNKDSTEEIYRKLYLGNSFINE